MIYIKYRLLIYCYLLSMHTASVGPVQSTPGISLNYHRQCGGYPERSAGGPGGLCGGGGHHTRTYGGEYAL